MNEVTGSTTFAQLMTLALASGAGVILVALAAAQRDTAAWAPWIPFLALLAAPLVAVLFTPQAYNVDEQRVEQVQSVGHVLCGALVTTAFGANAVWVHNRVITVRALYLSLSGTVLCTGAVMFLLYKVLRPAGADEAMYASL